MLGRFQHHVRIRQILRASHTPDTATTIPASGGSR